MFAHLDQVKTIELKYKLSDPRQVYNKDAEYSKYGPLGVIATLQHLCKLDVGQTACTSVPWS